MPEREHANDEEPSVHADEQRQEASEPPKPGKYLIVGLGNPGPEYAAHRHNVGFWTVNRLAKLHSVELDAGKNAWTGRGRLGDAEVVLMKPRTYVNRSGLAVAPAMQREGIPIQDVIVIYDELDLPEGRIRLRRKGSHGGYNGLKSIIEATGSSDFGRVRIGIGRPEVNGEPSWDPDVVIRHVLAKPTPEGKDALEAAVARACEAIEAIVLQGWDRAMNAYNAG
jgi:peptidyl-tRNA hydrolase, PTH1 family